MILEVWEACYLSRIIVGKPFLQTLRMTVYYRRWRLGKRWRQRKGPAFIRYKYCDCTGNHIRKRARMHPNTKYKWKIKGILWPNPCKSLRIMPAFPSLLVWKSLKTFTILLFYWLYPHNIGTSKARIMCERCLGKSLQIKYWIINEVILW